MIWMIYTNDEILSILDGLSNWNNCSNGIREGPSTSDASTTILLIAVISVEIAVILAAMIIVGSKKDLYKNIINYKQDLFRYALGY